MPKVVFEGDTHAEIVAQVKRWLASTQAGADGQLTMSQAVEQGAEITKDALRVIAAAAPRPVASNDLVKALTEMGYKATDATRDGVVTRLDQLDQLTGGSLLHEVGENLSGKGRNAMYEMNVNIAKQVLKHLHRT
jgi:hypothetical protein